MARIAVIAHRGASGLAGEDNTLRSFGLAIELGCDYAEFDVRRCRDETIVFHDAKVGDMPVGELSLVELRQRTGLEVPRLGEVLEFCRGRIGLDVELKDAGVEAEVVAALRPVAATTRLLCKSFSREIVRQLVGLRPEWPVGLLVPPGQTIKAAGEQCRDVGANFLSPHYSLLDDPAAGEVLERLPTYPWTVNDAAIMRRLCGMKIRGLITDRPDLLLEMVG